MSHSPPQWQSPLQRVRGRGDRDGGLYSAPATARLPTVRCSARTLATLGLAPMVGSARLAGAATPGWGATGVVPASARDSRPYCRMLPTCGSLAEFGGVEAKKPTLRGVPRPAAPSSQKSPRRTASAERRDDGVGAHGRRCICTGGRTRGTGIVEPRDLYRVEARDNPTRWHRGRRHGPR